MQERVSGYSMRAGRSRTASRSAPAPPSATASCFPGFYASGLWFSGSGGPIRPGFATPGEVRNTNLREARACTGPDHVHRPGGRRRATCKNLKAALAGQGHVEGYVAALGPLSLGAGVNNQYYTSEEEYMLAVADACARSTRRSPTPA